MTKRLKVTLRFGFLNAIVLPAIVVCFSWSIFNPSSWADDSKDRGQADVSKGDSSKSPELDYRQPIDLALSDDQRMLAVANQKTGDLVVWDIAAKSIVQRLKLASGLNDLQPVALGRLIAVSQEESKLFLLEWKNDRLALLQSCATSTAPIRAEWIPSQSMVRIACLWSRRIDTFQLSESKADEPRSLMQKVSAWDLSFAPRITVTVPERAITIVSDAFGSSLSIIDNATGRTRVSHPFLGHAICGVQSASNNELALAYASVNDYAETSENDIHWGVLLANDLRWISVDRLLSESREEVYRNSLVHPIGIPSNGAAELTSLSLSQEGFYVATVGGTDQVAVGTRDKPNFRYVNVGRFPVSSVVAESSQLAFVANKFEDSVSIVDLRRGKLVDTLWLGSIRPLTAAEKGERLFHDSSLSHDRWLTCASCHVDGHTNGLLTDNLGDRNYGAAKRVISLLGNSNTAPFNWLGLDPSLHSQIVRSVDKTMQSYRKLDKEEVDFIAAFCESLKAPPSVKEARMELDQELIEKGRKVFSRQSCNDCHLPPTYTTPETYNVGIQDEKGAKLFNPPSLRGLSQRGPNYFHDNRADGLKGVLVDHQHKLERPLSDEDRLALIAFLESL